MRTFKLLQGIKGAYDDGFYQRMLFIAPEPSDFSGEDIRDAPTPIVTTTSLVYLITLLNKKARHYFYTVDASSRVTKLFNKFHHFAKLANMFDFFFS